MFNIYGFVATPDSALILFSALFLLIYQRYLADQSWKNSLLMGLTMALMVYSKYHAFLLLGLIVLSNLRLLKDGKFYVACLLALALLIPHILWQINADFPSFRYHLSGRSEAFRWSYFWEYLPNQLLIFNPFTFGAVVYVLIKDRNCVRIPPAPLKRGTPTGVFERGLRFIFIGFFFFFWLMAFRGHVEPHWTIVCMIPMVVLVYRHALADAKLMKYIKYFVAPSLMLILAVRVALLTPMGANFGFYGKEAYFKSIETKAGNHPVVFRGSFQQPALYHFFTGKPSSTLQCYYDRMTQFDLWQFDKEWIGEKVYVCNTGHRLAKTYQIGNMEFDGFLAEHFQSANRLETSFTITNAPQDLVFHPGDTIHVDFSIHNPCDRDMYFHHPEFDMCIKAQYLLSNDFTYCFHDDINVLPAHGDYKGHLYTIVSNEIKPGKNQFVLGIGDGISSFVTESNALPIEISR